jgi:hypothetical protein
MLQNQERLPRDPISYEHLQIRASILVEKEQVMLAELSQLIDGEKCAVMIGEI